VCHFFEDLFCFVCEIGDRHALTALVIVELHLTTVAFELREKWDRGGVSKLCHRFDRTSHNLRVFVLKKPSEELRASGLSHFGEQERKLCERCVAFWKTLERTFDPESDLLESIERETFEPFAGRDARLRRDAAKNVDEKIDGLRPFQVSKKKREPHELDRCLAFIVRRELERSRYSCAELGQKRRVTFAAKRRVKLARRAFGVEKGGEVLANGRHGGLFPTTKMPFLFWTEELKG
jgi:hypothetical protein